MAFLRLPVRNVHMVDVATGRKPEQGQKVLAEAFPEPRLQMIGVIGGKVRAANGVEMQGKHGERGARRLGVFGHERNQPDGGVNGSGRADNAGVHLAGVETHAAIAHVKAAVERESGLFSDTVTHRHWLRRRCGLLHRFGDLPREADPLGAETLDVTLVAAALLIDGKGAELLGILLVACTIGCQPSAQ